MNAAILDGMKRKKKTSFLIPKDRLPRRVASIMKLAAKLDPAEVRRPTREEIADFAVGLAREDWHWGGVPSRVKDLFYWPTWAVPCRDERKMLLPIVDLLKKKAEETLRQHYAYYHALAVRRQRWLRAHPQPQIRGWTAKPSPRASAPVSMSASAPAPASRAAPPVPVPVPARAFASAPAPAPASAIPRKSALRLLPSRIRFPDAVSPPTITHPEASPNRPSRREREILLCYNVLFDNRIAVSAKAA